MVRANSERRERREHRRWVESIAPKKARRRVRVSELLSKQVRDTSTFDEITIGLAGVTVAGAAWGMWLPDRFVPSWLAWVTVGSAVGAVAAAVVFSVTTLGRVHRQDARAARWIERNVTRHFDDVVNVAAGLKDVHLIEGTVQIGPMVDPAARPDGAVSVIPPGPCPAWISFRVKPAGGVGTPESIAEGYRSAFSYGQAVGSGDPATSVLVELQLVADPPPWPIRLEHLPALFPILATELGLVDPTGQHPIITEVTASGDSLVDPAPADMAREPVLVSRPQAVAYRLFPSPMSTKASQHDSIVRKIADRLGYVDVEASEFNPQTGIHVVMWRDGKPPALPTTPDRLADQWDAVCDRLWPDTSRVRPPHLVSVSWGPVTPERPRGKQLAPLPSILRRARPTSIRFQLDIHEPKFRQPVVDALRHHLAYYRVESHANPTEGLIVTAHRDPLEQNRRIPLTELGTGPVFTIGDSYGQPMVWDTTRDPHMGIAGLTGSGKGDLQITVMAAALQRDWLVWQVNPKNSSEAYKLGAVAAQVAGLDQTAALMALALLEVRLRNWKIAQAAAGYSTDGTERSIKDHVEYQRLSSELVAAGHQPLPPIGEEFVVVFDESAAYLNEKNHGSTLKQLGGQLITDTTLFAEQARSTGGHLVLATQTPYVASFGGGAIKANLGQIVLLRTVKKESFNQLLPDMEPWDREALANGPGKGHNFHSSPTGVREGQGFWAGESSDWVADAIVPGFQARNPHVVARGRDYVAELRVARSVFGYGTSGDLQAVDHDQWPAALSGTPLTVLAESAATDTTDLSRLDEPVDVWSLFADLPSLDDPRGDR